jgi:hypothetical protein
MSRIPARSTDPISSTLAAEELIESGRQHTQQNDVYRAVREHPGMTSRELAQAMGGDRYTYARRLPEIECKRLVRKGTIRRCRIGRRPAVTWWLIHADD